MKGCTKIVKAVHRAFEALLARLIPKKKPKPKEKIYSRIYFVVDILAAKPY